MPEGSPLVNKEGQRGDNSPSFEAKQSVTDSTGKVLAIVGFGVSMLALGVSIPVFFQTRDTRLELMQMIEMSEARVIEDNRIKNTSFTLLDSHYRELKAMVDAQEKVNVRR